MLLSCLCESCVLRESWCLLLGTAPEENSGLTESWSWRCTPSISTLRKFCLESLVWTRLPLNWLCTTNALDSCLHFTTQVLRLKRTCTIMVSFLLLRNCQELWVPHALFSSTHYIFPFQKTQISGSLPTLNDSVEKKSPSQVCPACLAFSSFQM